MDQINIKTPNPKCHLHWYLIEFIDWRYSQPCWYFRPLLWTSALPTPTLLHFPLHLSCVNRYVFIQCVTGGGIGLCGKHLQELYTVYFTRFQIQKPRRGGGLRQINTCCKSLYREIFKKSRHLGLESISYLPYGANLVLLSNGLARNWHWFTSLQFSLPL